MDDIIDAETFVRNQNVMKDDTLMRHVKLDISASVKPLFTHYELFSCGDDVFVVKFDFKDTELIIPDAHKVREHLENIKHVIISPASVDGLMGLDGVTYTIEFFDFMNSSRFRWWLEAPEGWKELETWVQNLLELIEK